VEQVEQLAKQLWQLGNDLQEVRDDLYSHKVAHEKFRGRVYAWKKWEPEPPATPPQAPQAPLDLKDPSLTKAQVRAALEQQGRLKPRPN
jgi:hypothetical protein